jgi:hypothetical protein
MSRKISGCKSQKMSVGLFVSGALVAIAAQLLVAAPAKADCTAPDGTRVPTGARVGPYICMPDGTWQPG